MNNEVKVFRAKRDMSQDELSKLIGVSRQTIIAIEKKKYNPSLKLAYKIAKVFAVNVEEVFPNEVSLQD
ncbi:helix-turn-helix domain-containing protein [Salsuginibacillus kocurii]|uniref:helix-turn-helix transcriptional regulator n=1 Tax=Salsuginibacillus kocurii TaxID=427078 RepID=UPI000375C497